MEEDVTLITNAVRRWLASPKGKSCSHNDMIFVPKEIIFYEYWVRSFESTEIPLELAKLWIAITGYRIIEMDAVGYTLQLLEKPREFDTNYLELTIQNIRHTKWGSPEGDIVWLPHQENRWHQFIQATTWPYHSSLRDIQTLLWALNFHYSGMNENHEVWKRPILIH